jgi:hypothetical protein
MMRLPASDWQQRLYAGKAEGTKYRCPHLQDRRWQIGLPGCPQPHQRAGGLDCSSDGIEELVPHRVQVHAVA